MIQHNVIFNIHNGKNRFGLTSYLYIIYISNHLYNILKSVTLVIVFFSRITEWNTFLFKGFEGRPVRI